MTALCRQGYTFKETYFHLSLHTIIILLTDPHTHATAPAQSCPKHVKICSFQTMLIGNSWVLYQEHFNHTYLNMCICVHMSVCVHACVWLCSCECVHACCVCTCVSMHAMWACMPYVHVHICNVSVWTPHCCLQHWIIWKNNSHYPFGNVIDMSYLFDVLALRLPNPNIVPKIIPSLWNYYGIY